MLRLVLVSVLIVQEKELKLYFVVISKFIYCEARNITVIVWYLKARLRQDKRSLNILISKIRQYRSLYSGNH